MLQLHRPTHALISEASVPAGYYVEIEFSSTASLIVFLALFFANFAVSWLAVIWSWTEHSRTPGAARYREIGVSGDRPSGSKPNRSPRGKTVIAPPNKIGSVFGDPHKSPFALSRPHHRRAARVLDLDPIP
jgi:hypothetical protein